jgi:hypothetical protein
MKTFNVFMVNEAGLTRAPEAEAVIEAQAGIGNAGAAELKTFNVMVCEATGFYRDVQAASAADAAEQAEELWLEKPESFSMGDCWTDDVIVNGASMKTSEQRERDTGAGKATQEDVAELVNTLRTAEHYLSRFYAMQIEREDDPRFGLEREAIQKARSVIDAHQEAGDRATLEHKSDISPVDAAIALTPPWMHRIHDFDGLEISPCKVVDHGGGGQEKVEVERCAPARPKHFRTSQRKRRRSVFGIRWRKPIRIWQAIRGRNRN